MLKPGQKYVVDGIIIEVVEVLRYRKYRGGYGYQIGLRIRDRIKGRDFVSSVFHVWVEENEDPWKKIEQELALYKQLKGIIIR